MPAPQNYLDARPIGAAVPETGELPVIPDPVQWQGVTWRQMAVIVWRWVVTPFLVGVIGIGAALAVSFAAFLWRAV